MPDLGDEIKFNIFIFEFCILLRLYINTILFYRQRNNSFLFIIFSTTCFDQSGSSSGAMIPIYNNQTVMFYICIHIFLKLFTNHNS
jgi:hypothetical protein